MKLYKIKNNEILQEIAGQNLRSQEGFVEIDDEEAEAMRAKSYKKQNDFLKDGFSEIEKKYAAKKIELENQIKIQSEKANPNEEKLKQIENEIETLRDLEANEKAELESRIPETEEQKHLKIISAQADETGKRRSRLIQEQKEKQAKMKADQHKIITGEILSLHEKSRDKINNMTISAKEKKQQLKQLDKTVETELKKWGR